MPEGATFQPGAPAGFAFNEGLKAADTEQSWMTQNLQRQMMQQQMDQKQQLFDAALPTLKAKNQADQAALTAQIGLTQHMQDVRKNIYDQLPQIISEHTSALQIPDAVARDTALRTWSDKYAGMANIPELKPEFTQLMNTVATNHNDFMKQTLLDTQAKHAQALKAMEGQTAESIARIHAGAQVESAQDRSAATEKSAQVRAESTRNQVSSYESMADRELKMAASTDDPDEARQHRSAASRYQIEAHNILRSQSQNSQPASPDNNPEPSAKVPAVPANTIKYKVGDQDYPVFHDGNTYAYLKDGKYIELPTDYKPPSNE